MNAPMMALVNAHYGNCRDLVLWAYRTGRLPAPEAGAHQDIYVSHDGWCSFLKRGESCNCEPHVKVGMDLVRWEDMPPPPQVLTPP